MRLYDALQRHAGQQFPDTVVIEGSNVARLLMQKNMGQWGLKHFPNCAPPFERSFFEFSCPRDMIPDSIASDLMRDSTSWGVSCAAFSAQDGVAMVPKSSLSPQAINEMRACVLDRIEHVGWCLRLDIFVPDRGAVSHCQSHVKYAFVDRDGRPAWSVTRLSNCQNDPEFERKSQNPWNSYRLNPLFHAAFLAISFMHCKNVARVEHLPDPPLQKKAIKHHGIPLVKYYTLEIDPMKEVLRKEGGLEAHGLRLALHICRGHFAHYTPEQPLFGKLSGDFWIPQHLRGDTESGVIVKDYSVKGAVSQ